jgi:hypothetical protein
MYIGLAVAGLAISQNAVADHATNFLDALQSEVTNRLANADTNTSGAERRALANAARTLDRNTKTLSADLGVLAVAATQLNAYYTNDTTLESLETDALADYSAEARARLDGIYLWIGTNDVNRGVSNRIAKAEAALERANENTNGVPEQARALAAAFNKILPVEKKVQKLFDAPAAPPVIPPPPPPPPPGTNTPPPFTQPTPVPPGTPGLAPDSIGTRHVNLWENAIVNDQTVFYFSTAQSGAQIYNVHHPEELGLWTYVRNGANTGVIIVDPDYPDNAPQRGLYLTFKTATSGDFTGTTFFGEAIEGTFAIIQ